MRSIILAAALLATPLLAQAPQADPALDPARMTAARAFLNVALPPAQRDAMMNGIISGMLINMSAGILQGSGAEQEFAKHPQMRGVFQHFIDRQRDLAIADLHDNMPQLLEAEAHAYARLFTTEELNQLAEFLGKPVGQKYVTTVPKVFADPEVAEWQKGVALRAQQRMPGEIQKLKADMAAASGNSGAK